MSKREGAWSLLEIILAEKSLTVPDLHKSLRDARLPVNIKRLYRLTERRPLRSIDLNVAGAICGTLGIGLDDLLQFTKPGIVLERLDTELQYRLDELVSLANQRRLDARESATFDKLREKAQSIALHNARLFF